MNGAATDIAALLETRGEGTVGTDIFINKAPEKIAVTTYPIASINDTGGFDPQITFETRNYEPTIQVFIVGKASDFAASETFLFAIVDELLKPLTLTAAPYEYYGIYQQGDVIPLGEDDKQRPLFSANFRVSRREPGP